MKKIIVLATCAFIAQILPAETETVDGVTWHYYVTNGSSVLGRPLPENLDEFLDHAPLPAHDGALPPVLIIPETLGGFPVKAINGAAIQLNKDSGVELVVVPESVERISYSAFVGEYLCAKQNIVGDVGDMQRALSYWWDLIKESGVNVLFTGDCPSMYETACSLTETRINFEKDDVLYYLNVEAIYQGRSYADLYAQFYPNNVLVSEGSEGWTLGYAGGFEFHKTYVRYGAAKVEFSPNDERIPQSGKIELSSPNKSARIYYTLDGSNPTTNLTGKCYLYTEPIKCAHKMTVKALAYVDEYPYTAIYTRRFRVGDVATPIIEPSDTTFANASQTVTISCGTDGATIYYTTDGSDPLENGLVYKRPFNVYKSCTVRAVAVKDDWKDSAVATSVLTRGEQLSEAANFYGRKMETGADAPWVVDTEISHDGVSSVRSGGDGSYLQMSVSGAGTLSFWWRAMCEDPGYEYYDYGCIKMGGDVVGRIAGEDTGWEYFSTKIASTAKHVFRWEYHKDDEGTYEPDCIWVDQVQWVPTDGSGYTLTSPEAVPYSWLAKYGLGAGTDYETAANSSSGKSQNGKATKIWEEYVAGTDPTNETSVFTAKIEMLDGSPLVTWDPDLNTNGEVRVYTVYGKETLEDAKWTTPTNSAHRFFRVSVEMP